MVTWLVLLTIAVFIVVDVLSRFALNKIQESRIAKERAKALDIGLRLDYTDEAESLKRVEVDHPKASILAVDDESIVLDSFRKILVIAGYSIDTVETGKEAIGLVRKHDYDFVFTDLKMPEMDGLDVTKAVKHLRPETDVIMITGYATIESAVDAMKYGAMDYVQKPFTADELVEFVNQSLIRRQDRIARKVRPHVHLVTPSVRPSPFNHEFNVPAGVFISPTHTWVSMYLDGTLLIGVDDFVQKIIGPIDKVELPEAGRFVERDAPLFTIIQGSRRLTFASPASGKVVDINTRVLDNPALINSKPYEAGWLCSVDPSNLPSDLQALRIGADAVSWYQEEIDKYCEMMETLSEAHKKPAHSKNDGVRDAAFKEKTWETFSETFLMPDRG